MPSKTCTTARSPLDLEHDAVAHLAGVEPELDHLVPARRRRTPSTQSSGPSIEVTDAVLDGRARAHASSPSADEDCPSRSHSTAAASSGAVDVSRPRHGARGRPPRSCADGTPRRRRAPRQRSCTSSTSVEQGLAAWRGRSRRRSRSGCSAAARPRGAAGPPASSRARGRAASRRRRAAATDSRWSASASRRSARSRRAAHGGSLARRRATRRRARRRATRSRASSRPGSGVRRRGRGRATRRSARTVRVCALTGSVMSPPGGRDGTEDRHRRVGAAERSHAPRPLVERGERRGEAGRIALLGRKLAGARGDLAQRLGPARRRVGDQRRCRSPCRGRTPPRSTPV